MTITEAQEKLSASRVIEGTFNLIKARFAPFLLIALICLVVPGVILIAAIAAGLGTGFGAGTPGGGLSGAAFGPFLGIGIFAGVLLLAIGYLLFKVALLKAAWEALRGQSVDPVASVRSSLPLMLPLIGISLLAGLGVALGFILLVVPGLMMLCAWSVALPVRVAEGPGIASALGRSADLTRGSRWRIFGLLLLYFVGSSIVQGIVTAPFGGNTETFGQIMSVLFVPIDGIISAAGSMVLYAELRRLKEGGGLETAAVFD